MEHVIELLRQGITATKRDVFYKDVGIYKKQQVLDDIVEDIACSLGVARALLNVVAASKGLVYGHLNLHLRDGRVMDCMQSSNQGTLIPPPEFITMIETTATHILVIEKEATFTTLLGHKYAELWGPCVLITGKGYPDVATRALVKKLADIGRVVTHREVLDSGLPQFQNGELEWTPQPPPTEQPIPVLSLVDCDPHGFGIHLTYQYGSRALAFQAPDLVAPSLHCIGLHPSDWPAFDIGLDKTLYLTARDRSRVVNMLALPHVRNGPILIR
ncbi:Spo11/DNA topoisomerase VI subunit A [Phlyctochytrium arcticum]|nr:Spo11/DNA topoisomerase VI subunit A [Phlyctochytrium arcticum]